MKRLAFLFISVLLAIKCNAQGDSVAFGKNFSLHEGLYLTYSDLRHNWPIPKEKILTKIDKNQLDFYTKLIESEEIEYTERDGSVAKINSAKSWGFCQNNAIYININKTFYRIPVFGAISYFVAAIEIQTFSPGYNVFINSSGGTTTTEMREYLLEFYSGTLREFSVDLLSEMLKSDAVIYKEYMGLSKKNKKEQASRFIRKYNEKHPVYFPKN